MSIKPDLAAHLATVMAGLGPEDAAEADERTAHGDIPFLPHQLKFDRGRIHFGLGIGWVRGLNETANFVLPIPLKPTPEHFARIRKRDRDRAERMRLAGGPKPTLRERAVSLALEKGEVRTKDLTDIGVPRCYLARICEEGLLLKVGYGRYCAAAPKAA